MTGTTKSPIVAPYTARLGTKVGGPVSFAAYFLRDLHSQGKLSEQTISDIILQNGITGASVDDVIAAIKDHSGEHVSKNVADAIEQVARAGSDMN